MKLATVLSGAALLVIAIAPREPLAQQPAPGPRPLVVGNRLGLPVEPATDGAFEAMSSNVKVYGAIYSAESCSYDPERGVIVVPNRGVPQNVQVNNAWISFINHDGSVHTARWIGVQNPADRGNLTPPLVLNEPLGSDIANGMLYVADRDGGTTASDTSVAVVRRFDIKTGAPAGEFRVKRSTWFNDIAVAADGTGTPRRRAIEAPIRIPRPGKSGRSHQTVRRRSSCRVRRYVGPTASQSIRRATSSSSTPATTPW